MNTLLIIVGIVVIIVIFIAMQSKKANAIEGFNLDKINTLTGGFDTAIADLGQTEQVPVPEAGQQNVSGTSGPTDTTDSALEELLKGNLHDVTPEAYLNLVEKNTQVLGQNQANTGVSGGTLVNTTVPTKSGPVIPKNNKPVDAGISPVNSLVSGLYKQTKYSAQKDFTGYINPVQIDAVKLAFGKNVQTQAKTRGGNRNIPKSLQNLHIYVDTETGRTMKLTDASASAIARQNNRKLKKVN